MHTPALLHWRMNRKCYGWLMPSERHRCWYKLQLVSGLKTEKIKNGFFASETLFTYLFHFPFSSFAFLISLTKNLSPQPKKCFVLRGLHVRMSVYTQVDYFFADSPLQYIYYFSCKCLINS